MLYFPISPSDSALPGETLKYKNEKLHLFFHMLYHCIARVQPVASSIYSVLLLTTNANAAV